MKRKKFKTKLPKPYYDREGVTIYHGDCRDILPLLSQVHMVLTDPPYGVGCDWWDDSVPHELLQSLIRLTSGPIVWFGAAPQHRTDLLAFDPPPQRVCVWNPAFTLSKTAAHGFYYRWHPVYCWQLPNKHDGPSDDVWRHKIGIHHEWYHGQTKPLDLVFDLCGLCLEGVVLDPFLGSGTTLVAAHRRGLKAVGIEIEERWCKVAAERAEEQITNPGLFKRFRHLRKREKGRLFDEAQK